MFSEHQVNAGLGMVAYRPCPQGYTALAGTGEMRGGVRKRACSSIRKTRLISFSSAIHKNRAALTNTISRSTAL